MGLRAENVQSGRKEQNWPMLESRGTLEDNNFMLIRSAEWDVCVSVGITLIFNLCFVS